MIFRPEARHMLPCEQLKNNYLASIYLTTAEPGQDRQSYNSNSMTDFIHSFPVSYKKPCPNQ
jgi:hypothetical protein